MVAQLDWQYVKQRPGRALARVVSYTCFEGRPLTTRGRWINPWLERIGRRIARRRESPAPDRPLFILGTGRSGTTVLGKILSMHRDIGWLNEPKLMWHIACPDEDLNGNYTAAPARYRLDASDADERVRAAIYNLYAAYLATTRNTRVLDKYPELIFRVPFVRELFPNARFLWLTRNGYDTCRSITHWSLEHGAENGVTQTDWWGINNRKWHALVDEIVRDDGKLAPHIEEIVRLKDHVQMAAVEWDLSMREGLSLLKEYPESICRVSYEDLTAEPADVIGSILEFGRLDQDDVVTGYASRVLQPSPASGAGPIDLPPAIATSFATTMAALGYDPA